MESLWLQFTARGLPHEVVDRLKNSYNELKENYFLGKLKPSELEGGHFAEAVIRIIQSATGGLPSGDPYTPLGAKLPAVDKEVLRLASLPATYDKSLRIHIPRVLLSIYDIRNTRGVGHLAGEVNPNLADATLVVSNADWVLAELVRLFHGVDLNAAQALVDGLVIRRLPIIEMFGEFPKVLRAELSNPMKALAILYQRGSTGATSAELAKWIKVQEKDARHILKRHDDKALVHYSPAADHATITRRGLVEVEKKLSKDVLLR